MSGARNLIERASLGLPEAYEPPSGAGLEARFAQAFAQCLRIDQVGANDCFFDLGGDSLSAVELQLLISHDPGLSFPVSLLAGCSTPRQLALALAPDQLASQAEASSDAAGRRPPIFSVHGRGGYMLPAKGFFTGLHPQQKFHMFELPGLRAGTPQQARRRVEDIAQVYCDQLTAQYPQGPIHLAAFCAGCMIGMEMATRFSKAGRPVTRLVLVDPNIPQALAGLHRQGQWDDPVAIEEYAGEATRQKIEGIYRQQIMNDKARGRDPLERDHPGEDFSVNARAKLLAAFMVYKPEPVPVLAHVIMSEGRNSMLKLDAAQPTYWDRIIPSRKVHLCPGGHEEMLRTDTRETAALIQRIFDGDA